MGVRKGIREDIPSHPRAHLYLGARVPERQVTPESIEQHTPTIAFEVTKAPTQYTVTYTVNGLFEYRVDTGAWQEDADGSPITIERGLEDQTLYMRATLGNLQSTSSIPIAALSSGSSTLRNVPSITEVGQNTATDEITVSWTAPTNLETGDTYDLYWESAALGTSATLENVTSPYAHQRLGTGGHGLDLTSGGVVDDILYRVYVKSSGGTVVGQSSQLTVAADHF